MNNNITTEKLAIIDQIIINSGKSPDWIEMGSFESVKESWMDEHKGQGFDDDDLEMMAHESFEVCLLNTIEYWMQENHELMVKGITCFDFYDYHDKMGKDGIMHVGTLIGAA